MAGGASTEGQRLMERRYLIIDFMNMAFRAYYAYAAQGSFTGENGVPTGMTYGLLSMTISLIRDTNATHVAFASESPVRTDNALMVDEAVMQSPVVASAFPAGYKGGRKEMDPFLRQQLSLSEEACKAMGWPLYRVPGFEADDTLASMAKIVEGEGNRAIVVTGDQDLWQCVSDQTVVWAPKQGGVYLEINPQTIPLHLHGLTASDVVDFKALTGDSSDGYPGCPGMGPKGALKLLAEYGSVDGIYANIDKVKGAAQRKLIDGEGLVILSKALAQLTTTVPVSFNPDAGSVDQMPTPEGLDFAQRHGMKSIERRLRAN